MLDIANYAVTEQNSRNGTSLQLVNIVNAQSKDLDANDIVYKLILETNDTEGEDFEKGTNFYVVYIYEDASKNLKLVDWVEPMNSGWNDCVDAACS